MTLLEQYVMEYQGETEAYYEEFYVTCRKYHVTWSEASDGVRHFVAEVARYNFERRQAEANGIPLSSVRPVFDI